MSRTLLHDLDHIDQRGAVRRRRHRGRWGGVMAMALVLVGGGCAASADDSGDAHAAVTTPADPSSSSETTAVPSANQEQIGVDRSGKPISVVVPADATLFGGGTGVISENHHTSYVGLEALQPRSLAGGSTACYDDTWSAHSREPAGTAQGVARQLARLPGSTVVQPLTPTQALGHEAFHVRLRVNNGCPAGTGPYLVAEADSDFGLGYGKGPHDVFIDFLVVDVDGTPIVVALWHHADASSSLIHRAGQVRDSITFVAGA
jgi:hypothetical protein